MKEFKQNLDDILTAAKKLENLVDSNYKINLLHGFISQDESDTLLLTRTGDKYAFQTRYVPATESTEQVAREWCSNFSRPGNPKSSFIIHFTDMIVEKYDIGSIVISALENKK